MQLRDGADRHRLTPNHARLRQLGVSHSVVCAGMATRAVKATIEEAGASVVMKKDVTRGKGLRGSLTDHVREDLGPIAQPSEIELREALPKTRSGKIMRRLLKAESRGEDPGDTSTLAD